MMTVYDAVYCSLHVRVGNKAAIALYRGALGFETMRTEDKYYADGEDAFDMRVYFSKDVKSKVKPIEEEKKELVSEVTAEDSTVESKDDALKTNADKKKKRKNKK